MTEKDESSVTFVIHHARLNRASLPDAPGRLMEAYPDHDDHGSPVIRFIDHGARIDDR